MCSLTNATDLFIGSDGAGREVRHHMDLHLTLQDYWLKIKSHAVDTFVQVLPPYPPPLTEFKVVCMYGMKDGC